MGDNLKAASRFVSQSISSLDHITTASALPQDRILDSLAKVQRGAKTMRARAIYRAAQAAVDVVHKGQADDKLYSELGVVRSLVLQYQNGLDEILGVNSVDMPVAAPTNMQPVKVTAEVPGGEHLTAVTAPSCNAINEMGHINEIGHASGLDNDVNLLDDMMMPLTAADDNVVVNELADDGDVPNMLAGENLTEQMAPLVQFAPEPEQRAALQSLARLHNEGLQETRLMASNDMPEPNYAGVKPSGRVKPQSIESFMPELTNVVLTTARHMEKTVSISYAVEGVELHGDLADKMRIALSDLTVVLVTRSLETPKIRRGRGESGAGHISIMAAVKSGRLELSVECTGRDIALSDLEIPSWTALKEMGAAIDLGRQDGRLCLNITGLEVKLSKPRKQPHAAAWEQAS